MSEYCATESLIPTWMTIGFVCISLLIIASVSIYSMRILKQRLNSSTNNSNHWSALSISKKIQLWLSDVWSRKAVYLPLVSHFSDTATDCAAVVEFYQIARTYGTCNGLDIWHLFALSILSMILYRIVSAFVIWKLETDNPSTRTRRVCMQFIDIELFEILYISHWLGIKAKSSPQRLISTLEAVFEASPQSVVQIMYLITTRNYSPIIIVSSVLSLVNVTLTIISDDKKFLEISFASPFKNNERDFLDNITKDAGRYKFGKFVCLYLFRICDIPSQVLLYIFVWYYVGGYVLTALVLVDACIAVLCYLKTHNTDALMSVIALPFSFGPD
eukprot:809801_1